eukprot:TRINITY_DN2156_c0_g1_i2.p1 TRINITY_DN2156_c0_g1~~TRINITY_DN2156_c0_g1_i2.p1  ORF type:complete len:302 (+),score=71.84 TRINITY_DN2156_c0_g1_i2:274-1179(+)
MLDDLMKNIKGITLTRDKLERWINYDDWDEAIKHLFVRVGVGDKGEGDQIYCLAQIKKSKEGASSYMLGNTTTNKMLSLRIANNSKLFDMKYISNTETTKQEFIRWVHQMTKKRCDFPTKQEIKVYKQQIRIADIATMSNSVKDRLSIQGLVETESDPVIKKKLQDILEKKEHDYHESKKSRSSSLTKVDRINQRNKRQQKIRSMKHKQMQNSTRKKRQNTGSFSWLDKVVSNGEDKVENKEVDAENQEDEEVSIYKKKKLTVVDFDLNEPLANTTASKNENTSATTGDVISFEDYWKSKN